MLTRVTVLGVPIPCALAPFTSKFMILEHDGGALALKPAPDLDRLGIDPATYEGWIN